MGNIAETVSVVAESPAVDVQNARVQYVFKGDDIADLPTERDLGGLLNLVPSLTVTTFGSTCTGGVGAFCNGIAPGFNSHVSALDTDGQNQGRIVVDGMTINRGAAPQGINVNTGATNGIVLRHRQRPGTDLHALGQPWASRRPAARPSTSCRAPAATASPGHYFTSYLDDSFFDRNRGTRLSNTPATQDTVKDYDVNGVLRRPDQAGSALVLRARRARGATRSIRTAAR